MNLNELLIGLGFGKQTAIGTANTTSIWRLANWNKKPFVRRLVNENDATEIGKGHEFATQQYKSHYENPLYVIERPVSSENLAHIIGFGLGNVVMTGSGAPYTYTITPINPSAGTAPSWGSSALEVPYFTLVQQARPGSNSVLDELYLGCAIKSFRLSIKKGPGRESAMISAEVATSGLYTQPSAVTLAAQPAWHEMTSPSLSLTINGVDYVANGYFESLDVSWDNNFRPGFYPGVATQDGYATQGRFEVGDRALGFTAVVRFEHGSAEYTKLLAMTSGTTVIGLTNSANDQMTSFTFQKMPFAVLELSDVNGIVTVQITGLPEYDATNGLVSVVVKSSVTGICQ